MSHCSSRATANDCAANASLASIRSTSSSVQPALASTRRVADTGPMPIIAGSTPALAQALMVTKGLRPSSSARALLHTITAAAPSFRPEALPAVTLPPALNAAVSRARPSKVVPARGPWSLSNSVTTPFFCGMLMGIISLLKRPDSMAASAFCCELSANTSCCSRLI